MPAADAEQLTLAIPFYRGGEHLSRAIASALNQTNPNWRMLICDEGVDPAGPDVFRDCNDNRIRYVRNETPLGLAGNWNRCLDLAETNLVTIFHGDDELRPGYTALMANLAAEFPTAVALFCQADVIGPGGEPVFSFVDRAKTLFRPRGRGPIVVEGDNGLAALLRGNFIMCPTVCYRRPILGPRRFASKWTFVPDLELFSRLLLGGERLVGSRTVGYAYRRHPESATVEKTATLVRFREEAALASELAAAAAERGWRQSTRAGTRQTTLKAHLGLRALADLSVGRLGPAMAKARLLAEFVSARSPTIGTTPRGGE